MAGVKLTGTTEAIAFSAFAPTDAAMVVTVAGTASALPGTEAGTVKVTALSEYPGKGRGTGGVRCHRFRSGEDCLLIAWAGNGPVRAATASGVPVELPEPDARRDGTGVPARAPIGGIAGMP
jgi:DNA gyrase subunit A